MPPYILWLCLIMLGRLAFRSKTLDRKDALFWCVLSLCGTWAAVLIAFLPSREYASTYGRNVLVLSTTIVIVAGGSGVLVYLLKPVELPRILIQKYLEQRGFQNAFAMRFDYIIKTSKASIEGLEVHIAAGYGHPLSQEWTNLDLREYERNETVTGKTGEPVSRLSFLPHDSKQFTFVTFVITPKEGGGLERRAYMKVVDTSKRWKYEDVDFASSYPRMWIRFIGLPEKLEKQYVIVYNDPPWARGAYDKAVELLETDSERAKRLLMEYQSRGDSSSQGS